MRSLHIICGNCGSNAHLTFAISLEGGLPKCYMTCENCTTVTDLEENVVQRATLGWDLCT